MKYFLQILFIVVLLANCTAPGSEETGFITKLGNDTLAVEVFEKTETGLMAKVVVRSPQTTLTSYELTQDEYGGISEMLVNRYSGDNGFSGTPSFHQSIVKTGDSLTTDYITRAGTRRSYNTKYENGALPFIEMTHWPFELAFNEFSEQDGDTLSQKMISGNSIRDYIIADLGGSSRTVRHPSRGVMDVEVNDSGELFTLDAGQTTRKLVVTRTNGIDIDAIASRFIQLDKEGKSFGSLSGAVEEEFSFRGTTFKVEYGSPSRRGRDLFGGIVPWGQRWRTGANRATHFSTSKDLKIGSLSVPAGEYTLFAIPEPEGGTLIINKQTGQNGRTYDEARDLGRVSMQISTKEANTEVFTITVDENENGGTINLIWGETVFGIPFLVK